VNGGPQSAVGIVLGGKERGKPRPEHWRVFAESILHCRSAERVPLPDLVRHYCFSLYWRQYY